MKKLLIAALIAGFAAPALAATPVSTAPTQPVQQTTPTSPSQQNNPCANGAQNAPGQQGAQHNEKCATPMLPGANEAESASGGHISPQVVVAVVAAVLVVAALAGSSGGHHNGGTTGTH